MFIFGSLRGGVERRRQQESAVRFPNPTILPNVAGGMGTTCPAARALGMRAFVVSENHGYRTATGWVGCFFLDLSTAKVMLGYESRFIGMQC